MNQHLHTSLHSTAFLKPLKGWITRTSDASAKVSVAATLCTCVQVPGLTVPRVQHGIRVEDQGDPGAFVLHPTDRDAWSMQFFRSIDTTSAVGVPTTSQDAYALGFSSGGSPLLIHNHCILLHGREGTRAANCPWLQL